MPAQKLLILRACLSLLLNLFLVASVNAQPGVEPVLEYFSLVDGLSQAHINDIIQDSRGFIWLATLDGLNRYDGYTFRTYRFDPQDPFSLSSNSGWDLCQDRFGMIWVGTDGGGLNCYNPVDERFISYQNHPDESNSISNNHVYVVFEDSLGLVWAGTAKGLNRFDREKKDFQIYLPDAKITAITESPAGELWVAAGDSGLRYFDRQTHSFILYDLPQKTAKDEIACLYADNLGILWIGTLGGGINRYDPREGSVRNYRADNEAAAFVFRIDKDSSGRLWLATMGGLRIFNPQNDRFEKAFSAPDSSILNEIDARSLCQDASGIIWAGSRSGLFKINPNRAKFTGYFLKDPEFALSYLPITSVYEDENGLFWVGTEKGLYTFNRSTREYKLFSSPEDSSGFLSRGQIGSLTSGAAGTIWVPTVGGGLYWLDANHKVINHYTTDSYPGSLGSDFVCSVFRDQTGAHWVGTLRGGLQRFDPYTGRFFSYRHDPLDPTTISDNDIILIYEDREGELWIGAYNGLNRFDRARQCFLRYLPAPGRESAISHHTIFSIFQDKSGTLWVGAMDGLNRYDRKTDSFTAYTVKDGLPNNVILSINEDDDGCLWLGTNRGLSRFNPETGAFTNYDTRDGLTNNDFSIGACLKRGDSELVFGGANGLSFFHPGAIRTNPYPPPVVITDFRIMNKPVPISAEKGARLKASFTEVEEVQLFPGDYFFSFEFAALEYTDPEKNQYAYMLEGFDPDWNHSGTRRYISYTNIPPGRYSFRIKAANNDGLWNETGAAVRIVIHPPIWRTWWFRLFAILLVLALLIREFRRIHTRRRYLEKLVAERTANLATAKREAENANKAKSRFLAVTSHELRSPLTGIISMADRLLRIITTREQREYTEVIKSSGDLLLSIVNDLLDLAKIEAGKMELESKPFCLRTLLERVVIPFNLSAVEKRLEFHCRIDPALPRLLLGDTEKIRRIVMNLLDNALKFTIAGEVSFVAELLGMDSTKAEIALRVADTGIGIPIEKLKTIFEDFAQVSMVNAGRPQGAGLGLAIADRLAKMMEGRIRVESTEGVGSCFECLIRLEVIPDEQARAAVQTGFAAAASGTFSPERELKILIAEDEPVIQEYLRLILAEQNHHTVFTASGEEALSLLARDPFHCILMDIHLPGLDGVETTKIIRKNERETGAHIPIIALTASALAEERAEFLEAGMDYFLSKPINEEALMSVLNRIARR